MDQLSEALPVQPDSGRQKPKKLRRSTRACDFCHRRSIRCKPSIEPSRCQNCVDFDVPCTYDRPAKKRGVKAASSSNNVKDERDEGTQHANLLLHLTHENVHSRHQGYPYTASVNNGGSVSQRVEADALVGFALGREHRDMVLSSRDKISNLASVYFEVVYPIFPLFHKKTILRKIASRDYLRDPALFAAVMSMCALSSSRVRDGALPPGRWDATYFTAPTAETFFAAARDILPPDLAATRGTDWMRCCAMLALYGIQIGKTEVMHQYLGLYHSLLAMDGMHDEKNWPANIGIVELEMRRRLFWSMYNLEVYCSIVWGSVIRCRESQSRVAYPSEVDDDFFSDQGFERGPMEAHALQGLRTAPDSLTDPSCWLHGFNFTTDLYRILEHAMNDFHRRRSHPISPFSPSDLFLKDTPPPSVVLEKVMSMHEELPARFKESRNVASEMSEDIFSFQAANIAATLQMVRMVLFTAEDATVEQKCAIARELLDGFSKVPCSFLKAISTPLLYHLAGIGGILGSVIEGPLSESSYLQVRNALLAMADLLSTLETGHTRTIGAAARTRNLVNRIDDYMLAQRHPEASQTQPVLAPTQHNQAPRPLSQASSHNSINSHNHVQHSPSYAPPMSVGNMMNVDPALQGLGQQQHPTQWDASRQLNTGFGYSTTGAVAGLAGLGSGNGVVSAAGLGAAEQAYEEFRRGNNEFQFQLPPELLEDWPWPIDATQGFQPGFGGFA